MTRSVPVILLAALLDCGAAHAQQLAPASFDAALQHDFVDGMTSYSGRDYARAEAIFRHLLDRQPSLLRVRLELARTLYMERKDEQADYLATSVFQRILAALPGAHAAA